MRNAFQDYEGEKQVREEQGPVRGPYRLPTHAGTRCRERPTPYIRPLSCLRQQSRNQERGRARPQSYKWGFYSQN